MTLPREEITCYILAGGQSTRMGTDKGKLLYGELSFVEHLVKLVEPIASKVVVLANQPGYEGIATVMNDEIPMIGPLGGIITGLRKSSTEKNLFISCDTPKVSLELLELLLSKSASYDVCCPFLSGLIHPLIGVYAKSAVPEFEANAQKGNLSITNVVIDANHNLVNLEKPEYSKFKEDLININTKEEYEQLQKQG